MRAHAGRRKADMRHRLRQAAEAAVQKPERQLGQQTQAALQQLLAVRHMPQASAAIATLAMCTTYSKGCCMLIAGAVHTDWL